MAEIAIAAARAQKKRYNGKTSPHWYDTDSFHELLLSIKSKETTIREFIAVFDGCSAKAGEIAGEHPGRVANSLSRDEASRLLSKAKSSTASQAARLGELGKNAFSGAYAKSAGFIAMRPCADDWWTVACGHRGMGSSRFRRFPCQFHGQWHSMCRERRRLVRGEDEEYGDLRSRVQLHGENG